jgi:hypothetical protein
MRLRNTLWVVMAMVVSGNAGDVWAYESGILGGYGDDKRPIRTDHRDIEK